jgi:hypothetical protein
MSWAKKPERDFIITKNKNDKLINEAYHVADEVFKGASNLLKLAILTYNKIKRIN